MTKPQQAARAQRAIRVRKLKLALGSAAAVAAIVCTYWISRSSPAHTSADAREESGLPSGVPPFFATEEAAQPLPVTLSPELFRNALGFEAYRIAKNIPGVLAQQPCYCNCEAGFGHRSLLDCYRENHAAG
jgi:hypothetical protein